MKTHKITVPVIFWCEALSATRRTKRERLDGYIPVDIEVPEFETSEAPIACRYPESYKPEDTTPVRFFDGRFFIPVDEGSYNDGTMAYVNADTFLENSASGYVTSNPLADNNAPVSEYLRGELQPFNSEAFKDYDRVRAQKNIDEMLETAKSLALIDGKVWKEIAQPVYSIVSPMHFRDQRYGAWVQVKPLSDDMDKREIVALSAWEEAVHIIKTRFGDTLSERWKAEVNLPDVFGFDFTKPVVLEDLTKARDAQLKAIGNADTETMIAWAHFRDAVDRAIESSTDEAIDEAIDHYGKMYRESPQPSQDAIKHLLIAEDRWTMRVITPSSLRLG
jgi:hypothetical protein